MHRFNLGAIALAVWAAGAPVARAAPTRPSVARFIAAEGALEVSRGAIQRTTAVGFSIGGAFRLLSGLYREVQPGALVVTDDFGMRFSIGGLSRGEGSNDLPFLLGLRVQAGLRAVYLARPDVDVYALGGAAAGGTTARGRWDTTGKSTSGYAFLYAGGGLRIDDLWLEGMLGVGGPFSSDTVRVISGSAAYRPGDFSYGVRFEYMPATTQRPSGRTIEDVDITLATLHVFVAY